MCIEGSITFTIDGERRDLGPGGTWRITSNLPHDAVAGPDGAVVVDIFSPVRADWDALPAPRPGQRAGPAAGDANASSGSCSAIGRGLGQSGRARRSAIPCSRVRSRTLPATPFTTGVAT